MPALAGLSDQILRSDQDAFALVSSAAGRFVGAELRLISWSGSPQSSNIIGPQGAFARIALMREMIVRITIRKSMGSESGDDGRPVQSDLLADGSRGVRSALICRNEGAPSSILCAQLLFRRLDDRVIALRLETEQIPRLLHV